MTVSTPRGPLTGMTPADIVRTIGVSSPALSPDGTRVAYVVTRVDAAADGCRSAVWTVNSDGSMAPLEYPDEAVRTSPLTRRLTRTARAEPTTHAPAGDTAGAPLKEGAPS